MKKHLCVLLVVAMILSSCAACSAGGKQSYQNGVQAFLAGNYTEAYDQYRTSISQGNEDGVVFADLALACLFCDKEEEGEKYLNKALEVAPESCRVLKKAGIFYMEQSQDNLALEYFSEAILHATEETQSDSIESYGFAASIQKKHGCFDEAVRLYNYLIEKNDHVLEHTILAGICYIHLLQFSSAKAYFDLLLEDKNMTPFHYLTIYNACTQMEGYVDASYYLEEGKKLIESKDYGISLAEYYAAAGLDEEAKKEAVGKTDEGSLLALAKVNVREENYQEAEKNLLSVLALNPDSPEAYLLYLIVKIQTGDYQGGKQVLTKISTFQDDALLESAAWDEMVLLEKMQDFQGAYDKVKTYMTLYFVNEDVRKEYLYLVRQIQ